MAQIGSWCLSPEIKECFCISESWKRWVLCGSLCSQTELSPQPFSLTFKVVQARKLRWKLRKIFWQSELMQRNNLLKENVEVLTQTNDRKSPVIFLDMREEPHLSVPSQPLVILPWALEEKQRSHFLMPQLPLISSLLPRMHIVGKRQWQTHEEIICLSSRLGTYLCISWVSFLKKFFSL